MYPVVERIPAKAKIEKSPSVYTIDLPAVVIGAWFP